MNKVGVIVDFKDSHIGVFSMSDAEAYEELRGELMLLANFIIRTASSSKKSSAKDFYLVRLCDGLAGVDRLISDFAGSYKHYNNIDDIEYEYKLLERSDRQFSFILNFDENGNHTTQFHPKGFGILGKNIEASSMFASVLFIDFLQSKYHKKTKVIDIFDEAIADVASTIMQHRGKLSVKQEWEVVAQIGKLI